MLKLLRLGAGAGISDFSTSSLAAASCICWALMWMVGAGTLATTLVVGGQAHDRKSQDPAFLTTCNIFANLFPAAYTGVHERTFLAVKPDGVQRRLVGEIVRRFERKGFKLVALKLVQASEELLREHYAELRERPFFGRLVKYMGSGPVVAMVWQGLDVVRASRALIGATNPADAAPGTIRGDFCIEVGKNVIHGSDSVESARREIALWFRTDELLCWEDSAGHWLYE